MGQRFKLLWNTEKSYVQLASANSEEIGNYNEKMLSALTLMGGNIILLTLISVPFSKTKVGAVPVYFLAGLLFFTLFLLFKISAMKKYAVVGLYLCFSILFLFAVYLSIIHTPNMRATILLGAFCIMPLGFIDHPCRMNLFVVFWVLVHTILAFYLKPQYALDDTINSLGFALLGCFIGNIMIRARLEGYEAQRLLIIEKKTDVLTGLFNRRKLFETLSALETKDVEKPTGILMIDIDYFKSFNDNHGHATGDRCLGCLGETFRKFEQNFRIRFYRYGGEEFVAMAYDYNKEELLSIAEGLRIAVQSADIGGHCITVSIGVAHCGNEKVRNYERVIDRADKAAYAAKSVGRNKVCMEQNEI